MTSAYGIHLGQHERSMDRIKLSVGANINVLITGGAGELVFPLSSPFVSHLLSCRYHGLPHGARAIPVSPFVITGRGSSR